MHKLPETPNRKYKRRMHKEKEPSQQKKETRLLSAVTFELKIPILFLLLVEGHMSIYAACWFTFPRVAAISVTSNP